MEFVEVSFEAFVGVQGLSDYFYRRGCEQEEAHEQLFLVLVGKTSDVVLRSYALSSPRPGRQSRYILSMTIRPQRATGEACLSQKSDEKYLNICVISLQKKLPKWRCVGGGGGGRSR